MKKGYEVLLIGGKLKGVTEAIVGAEALESLNRYNFTKGFFGTNGVSQVEGLTTPDAGEALIKQVALEQCRKSYVLCDSSKFDKVSSVTFGSMEDSVILTEKCPERYKNCRNIVVCK